MTFAFFDTNDQFRLTGKPTEHIQRAAGDQSLSVERIQFKSAHVAAQSLVSSPAFEILNPPRHTARRKT